MQQIRPGSLYFLTSPFHFTPPTSDSTEVEKRLSYLLGTVSARPAVVIRAPSWWDKFNTVTVIPALSKGKPAITYHMQDRYGHETQAAYPFVPHNPHTIPVSRLGKYIGALSQKELDDLLYAFKWIHDPSMQEDPNCPVPEIYNDYVGKDIPASWKMNKDARSDVDLVINRDSMVVHSKNHPSLNGFQLGKALEDHVPEEVLTDQDYVATDNPLPDSDDVVNEVTKNVIKEYPVAKEVKTGLIRQEEPPKPPIVTVEKDFPPSTFPKETLQDVAGRFDISAAYFNGDMKTRDPAYLTEDEIRSLRGTTTTPVLDELIEYYKTLTPMDAYILGPRLPTDVLQRITGFTRSKTATLKRLCNVMRDIPEDDYVGRVQAVELAKMQEAIDKEEKKKTDKEERKILKEEQTKLLDQIRPYLSQDRILNMVTLPDVQAFLALPMGVVKRAWSGTNFKESYQKAKSFYKRGLKLYDEILEKSRDENGEVDQESLKVALTQVLLGED